MLARPFERGGKRQDHGLVEAGGRGDAGHRRFALGQRPRLVHHQRVDLLHALEGGSVLDEHAGRGSLADADHDRHRRRQTECARTGDDQHGDGDDQRVGAGRRRSPDRPGDEGDDRDADHRRDEPSGDGIGKTLDRRPAALRFRDHLHDAGQHRLASDLLGAHDQPAAAVDRAADQAVARTLLDRHRLAGDHQLVDHAATVHDDAIDGHALARPHPQAIADLNPFQRDLLVAAAVANAPGGLRGEIEERADRAAGPLARAQFEHLPQQHQHRDHRRRLEIDGDGSVRTAKPGREEARRQRRDDTEEISGAGAERDQAEHVEAAIDHRSPAAHEERRARPQHDRCRQRQLDPRGKIAATSAERGGAPASAGPSPVRPAARSERARSRTDGPCPRARGSVRC